MKNGKKWENPDLGVMKRSKTKEATGSSRSVKVHNNLGFGPPLPTSTKVYNSLGFGPPLPVKEMIIKG